mgnify:CR=1 FL=1
MAECAQLSQFDDELYKVTGEWVVLRMVLPAHCRKHVAAGMPPRLALLSWQLPGEACEAAYSARQACLATHTVLTSCLFSGPAGEGDEKYLIATSEQTLCAMHRKDWFEKGQVSWGAGCGYRQTGCCAGLRHAASAATVATGLARGVCWLAAGGSNAAAWLVPTRPPL